MVIVDLDNLRRSVSCRLEAEVTGPADITLAVALASDATITDESLSVTIDGVGIAFHEILDDHGGRLHRAAGLDAGRFVVDYSASVSGRGAPPPVTEIDLI